MDVQALRDYVRNHLDVDEEELPNLLLNVYLQDGFEKTASFDNRWPRKEKTWAASKVIDAETVTMPSDLLLSSITNVVDISTNLRLTYISHENAYNVYAV